MKTILSLISLLALILSPHFLVHAEDLVALSTDGTIYQVDETTGALQTIASDQLTSFTLGAIVRRKDSLYYIAAPSGTAENSIFTADLKTGSVTKVDLDRVAGDDEARHLFFKGSVLYGTFYNGNAGTAGVYRIDPTTGQTTLTVDFSSLGVEPVGGAIAQFGALTFIIVKSETTSTSRSLLAFKPQKNAIQKNIPITDKSGAPVTCEKLKINLPKLGFTCLAAPSETSVSICSLKLNGKANCKPTLPNVLRVAGGHTMMTPNGKEYFALVYDPSDQNSQRLIRFSANGKVKSTVTINSILIGARFGKEEPSA